MITFLFLAPIPEVYNKEKIMINKKNFMLMTVLKLNEYWFRIAKMRLMYLYKILAIKKTNK